MKHIQFFAVLLILATLLSCDPQIDDDIDLGPLPAPPEFSVTMVPGDSNRFVVQDLYENSFERLWTFEGGDPRTSELETDTVFYAKAGTYKITLYIAEYGGDGTSKSSQTVTVVKDVASECGEMIALLTGDCGPEGKCWTFSTEAGAVTVGPTYGSSQWFSSPEGGLQPEQYDDSFCFFFEGNLFEYRNNGATISPWDGYVPVAYAPPPGDWLYREGTGMNGADQIILPDEHFMGVWDSDNILDVVFLTEDALVVRTRIADQQGNPAAEGWFELHFVAR